MVYGPVICQRIDICDICNQLMLLYRVTHSEQAGFHVAGSGLKTVHHVVVA